MAGQTHVQVWIQIVALDATGACLSVCARRALVTVVVKAVPTLILTDFKVVLLARLLVKSDIGRDGEKSTDDRSDYSETQGVFRSDITSVLDALFEVHSSVSEGALQHHLEDDPGRVDDGSDHEDLIERVLRLAEHLRVVPKE